MDVNYKMGCIFLRTTINEKDLVTLSADIKVSEQCIAAAKGNNILGLIVRNIAHKENYLLIPLYKAIVRPHFEYRYRYGRANVSSENFKKTKLTNISGGRVTYRETLLDSR